MKRNDKGLGVSLLGILALITIACSCGSLTSLIPGFAVTPTPATNLDGVGIRIVYIQSREADAMEASDRLQALGATVDTFLTSDDGNDDFVNHIFYDQGYDQVATFIASRVSDLEYVTPVTLTEENPYPDTAIYLCIVEPK